MNVITTQGSNSQHSVIIMSYEWAQKARVLHYSKQKMLTRNKHSSLYNRLARYKGNKVSQICCIHNLLRMGPIIQSPEHYARRLPSDKTLQLIGPISRLQRKLSALVNKIIGTALHNTMLKRLLSDKTLQLIGPISKQ